jgi:hypothetical protein
LSRGVDGEYLVAAATSAVDVIDQAGIDDFDDDAPP